MQLLVRKNIPISMFWFYCTHVWLNSETFEHCTHILTKACSQYESLLMVTRRLLWSMCWVRARASSVVLMITGLAHKWRQPFCKNNCSVPYHNFLVVLFLNKSKRSAQSCSFPKQINMGRISFTYWIYSYTHKVQECSI